MKFKVCYRRTMFSWSDYKMFSSYGSARRFARGRRRGNYEVLIEKYDSREGEWLMIERVK